MRVCANRDPYPRLRTELPGQEGPPCPQCGAATKLERVLIQRAGEPVTERVLARCTSTQKRLRKHIRRWRQAAGLVKPEPLCDPILITEQPRPEFGSLFLDLSKPHSTGLDASKNLGTEGPVKKPRVCVACGNEFAPRRINQSRCDLCRLRPRKKAPKPLPLLPEVAPEVPTAAPPAIQYPSNAPEEKPARGMWVSRVALLALLRELPEDELDALYLLAKADRKTPLFAN
jgi:hypothetical protein